MESLVNQANKRLNYNFSFLLYNCVVKNHIENSSCSQVTTEIQNSYDVMKPHLLKSRHFLSFDTHKTNGLQRFQSFMNTVPKAPINYYHNI